MKVWLTFILVLFVLCAIIDSQSTPVLPEPKQSHYVVYVLWCGYTQGVLITTVPPKWLVGSDFVTGSEMALVNEALTDGRVRFIALENRGCPEFKAHI